MDLKLTLTKDADGIHLVDSVSCIGLHWKTKADAKAWLKQTDGEEWEQSFRAALKDIMANIPELDQPVTKKDFTIQPAKAVAAWP